PLPAIRDPVTGLLGGNRAPSRRAAGAAWPARDAAAPWGWVGRPAGLVPATFGFVHPPGHITPWSPIIPEGNRCRGFRVARLPGARARAYRCDPPPRATGAEAGPTLGSRPALSAVRCIGLRAVPDGPPTPRDCGHSGRAAKG